LLAFVHSDLRFDRCWRLFCFDVRKLKTLIDLFTPVGPVGLLFGLNIATTVLNAFVSNSASVSLVFPIGYSVSNSQRRRRRRPWCNRSNESGFGQIAKNSNISLRGITYNVMMAGSADFST
jgi:hypothetical protein